MTNNQVMQIAMQQSAVDSCCCADDFLQTENKVVTSQKKRVPDSIWTCLLPVT